MKSRIIILTLIVITGTIIYTEEPKEPVWKEYALSYSNDWNTLKGISTIYPKTGEITKELIPLPNAGNKDGFACALNGKTAKFDTDGDGSLDKETKSAENLIDYKLSFGMFPTAYRLRVWSTSIVVDSKPQYLWHYQRGGFMKGNVAGEQVLVIDDNNNGLYAEYGEDAIVVGASKQANLLSRMVCIKNKFYEVEMETSGEKIKLKEYTGLTGQVDVKSGWKHDKLKPDKVILQQQDNQIYLDIPLQSKTFAIPVGKYKLFYASFGKRVKAKESTQILAVVEDKDIVSALKWGGPFKMTVRPEYTKGGTLTEPSIGGFTGVSALAGGGAPVPAGGGAPVGPGPGPGPAGRGRGPIPELPPNAPAGLRALAASETAGAGAGAYANPKGPVQLSEKKISQLECPFIAILEMPKIYGENGEEYYCDRSQDFAFPDDSVFSFNMLITPKNDAKPLNKTGNPVLENWCQLKVGNEAPHWEPYQCPLYNYRGGVSIKISVKSQIFGELSCQDEINVQ